MPTLSVPELTFEGRVTLAREVESVQQGYKERGERTNLSNLLNHINDQTYPTDMIVRELITLKLKWFAQKIVTNQYASTEVNEDTDDSSDEH